MNTFVASGNSKSTNIYFNNIFKWSSLGLGIETFVAIGLFRKGNENCSNFFQYSINSIAAPLFLL